MNVLLPASGYGKRNLNEPIKELMLSKGSVPEAEARPLIEFSFHHLLEPKISDQVNKIVIITRKEKLSPFTLWLENFSSKFSFKIPVEFLLYKPGPGDEWPLTIAASKDLWAEKNLVLLPDTQLMLRDLVGTFDENLEGHASVFGAATIDDLEKVKSYGMIRENSVGQIFVTEKPQNPTGALVWGCFGFQQKIGHALLQDLEKSTHTHTEVEAPPPSKIVKLESFTDLSRV